MLDESVCARFQTHHASDLQDIHAARLYPCGALTISVDIFHKIYLSLRDNPLVSSDHTISVEVFHKIYLSLHDNPLVSSDAMCVYIAPYVIHASHSLYTMLKAIFRASKCSLYTFLQSNCATFLRLLVRIQFVHAVLIFCIPWEEPGVERLTFSC